MSKRELSEEGIKLRFVTPAIEQLVQAALDARTLFLKNSLADLYDPFTIPPELLKAHQNLDRAVMKLYGLKKMFQKQLLLRS